jgi:hypothetical protein
MIRSVQGCRDTAVTAFDLVLLQALGLSLQWLDQVSLVAVMTLGRLLSSGTSSRLPCFQYGGRRIAHVASTMFHGTDVTHNSMAYHCICTTACVLEQFSAVACVMHMGQTSLWAGIVQ